MLGVRMFESCDGLKDVVLPTTLTQIGSLAFAGCDELASVSIGPNVTSIGEGTFYDCYCLRDISCRATTPPEMLNESCFHVNTYNYATLRVPESAIEAYRNTNWWSRFYHIVPITCDVNGDGVVTIADVTALIDYIMGVNDSSFDEACADLDEDGIIGINDVTMLIDYILSH